MISILKVPSFSPKSPGIRKVLIESLKAAAAVRWSHVGLGGVEVKVLSNEK